MEEIPMKHIVGLSGGKDSTALALRLAEIEPRDYEYICNETGNELPEMHAHWEKLETMLGKKIIRVRHDKDLEGTIRDMNMLPSVFARWCTRVLKIEPTIEYMSALPEGSTLYVGLRADEEARRGLFGEDIKIRFPMREWGWNENDVWTYLAQRGVEIPKRTDCALYPYQRLGEWRDLHSNYPVLWARGVALEKELGHTFRSPGRDTWPADLESLGKEFDKGRKLREYKRNTTCRVCSL
jgi:3'-phosphoadenosine 5'-phosphosulfate sulfotransferase (PAPS reductase)/FAD synthetase